MNSTEEFLEKIYNYSLHKKLPAANALVSLAQKTISVLQSEDSSYRPRINFKGQKCAGGFLDFRKQESLPCIVVPDIHARPDFLFNVLNFVLPKKFSFAQKEMSVAQALDNGEIRVVCVGDLLHGEARVYDRWLLAYKDFLSGVVAGKAMKAEMREGLAAQMAVMECKCRWPKNFHCLKGNHENIKNETGGGNYGFRKFVQEGEMVFSFMQEEYGEEVLNTVYDFEKSLPLAFCAENIFVSHAEPLTPLSEEVLVNAPLFSEVILALTWTANDEAENGSVKKMLKDFCKPKTSGVEPIYIGGHRPVMEKYFLRQNGLYVQIHNPMEQNVAVVLPQKTFNPETDIVSVEK